MADFTRILSKAINRDLLVEEVRTAFGENSILFAGFVQRDRGAREWDPFPEATRKIGESQGVDDIAQSGELRFSFRNAIDPAALDALLTAHDATGRSTEQRRRDQDIADVAALHAEYVAGGNLSREGLRLMARLVLRANRSDVD